MSTGTTLSKSSVVHIGAGHRLQHEEAQDGWVLLYPEGMIKLNQSAAEILKRCDGKRTITDVIGLLEMDFEQKGLEPDVISFLEIALEKKWVRFDDV